MNISGSNLKSTYHGCLIQIPYKLVQHSSIFQKNRNNKNCTPHTFCITRQAEIT